MKSILFSALLLALCASSALFALFTAFRPADSGTESTGNSRDLAKLERKLEEACKAQASLGKRLAELEASRASEADSGGTGQEDKAQRKDGGGPAESNVKPAGKETSPAGEELSAREEFDLDESLGLIMDPETNDGERQQIWNDIVREGRLDEAIAFFEERARANPDDPDCQVQAGHAYLQKIFTVPLTEKMKWSMKADASYDRALELDDHHWEARFVKAINYSFIPPIMGYRNRAIEQFEILREQQEAREPKRHFAETYLFLGNLYSSQGREDKAREIWTRGAELFPEAENLVRRARQAGETAAPEAPAR